MAFTAAWLSVRSQRGELLLRVEDVDRSRARRAVEANQKRDLEWLGLTWDREVSPQRDRDYAPWLALLSERYFCQCTRRSIAEGGNLHPLICRSAGHTEGAVRYALPDTPVRFVDRVHGMRQLHPLAFGDPVLRRRDGVYAYSLAVVADDIADGITEVVRGSDLLDYTAVQTVLWDAFGATPPTWLHAPMLVGEHGEKLSKSKGDIGIATLREAGVAPQQILDRVLGWLGQDPAPLEQVVFAPERIPVSEVRLASPTAGLLD